ncbi:MAG: tRNA pseudouridine(55) synthase TruB [Acutalibacteraceae bacterium]|nr:tRNA pseudouridine(55) synthase TruB [Acutalibacteraceae bacterium]
MLGLLLINKPQGITSFGAVARIKRICGERRVGHTGTLDPMATGVLPVFIGRATALSSYLLEADKRYTARVRLGVTTDTCDITGTVLTEKSVSVTNEQVIAVLEKFTGKQKQIPPMFSALKRNGVPLYELARKGINVDIPARDIEVLSLVQTSPLDNSNEFDIDVCVSKGTYIRSLCRDIGEALGCGATLSALCRTETAGFPISRCVDLDKLTSDNVGEYILPADTALQYMPSICVTENQAVRFTNGGQLSFDRIKLVDLNDGTLYRVYCKDVFLGLGFVDCENRQLGVKCVIQKYEG